MPSSVDDSGGGLLYHGKTRGVLTARRELTGKKVCDHPFFNMRQDRVGVEERMEEIRGGRHRDLVKAFRP